MLFEQPHCLRHALSSYDSLEPVLEPFDGVGLANLV